MTNATKAQIGVFINAVVSAIVVFGLLSNEKAGALGLIANAGLGVFVALTYKDSEKRLPEGLSKETAEKVAEVVQEGE